MSDLVPFSVSNAFEQVTATEGPVAGRYFSPARSPDRPPLEPSLPSSNVYYRYHIETQTTPDIVTLPPRFQVKVKKHRLVAMVLKELFEYKGTSR